MSKFVNEIPLLTSERSSSQLFCTRTRNQTCSGVAGGQLNMLHSHQNISEWKRHDFNIVSQNLSSHLGSRDFHLTLYFCADRSGGFAYLFETFTVPWLNITTNTLKLKKELERGRFMSLCGEKPNFILPLVFIEASGGLAHIFSHSYHHQNWSRLLFL